MAFSLYEAYRWQLLNRAQNMQFITVIFLALAFTCSTGDKLNDAIDYLDEVLAEHLPSAIEAVGLKFYKLPAIIIDHQEQTSEDHVVNTKIQYRAGNLTGLQEVLRDMCFEPSESSGNVSFVCDLVLPHLQAEYAGRFQLIKGFQNPFGVHIRQFDFTLDIDIRDVKVEIEVTSSSSIQIPSLKRLSLKSGGKRSIKFYTEAPKPEDVTKGVEERFNVAFNELFSEGLFKKVLETSVGEVRFPKSE